jgi:hypothetical protein
MDAWAAFLNPEVVRPKLIAAGLFLLGHEMLIDSIKRHPLEFFSNHWTVDGPVPNDKYRVEVLALDPKGKNDALNVDLNELALFHTAILGVTGSGKSFLAYQLIERCAALNIKVVCIDPTGDYQRHLADAIMIIRRNGIRVSEKLHGLVPRPIATQLETAARHRCRKSIALSAPNHGAFHRTDAPAECATSNDLPTARAPATRGTCR